MSTRDIVCVEVSIFETFQRALRMHMLQLAFAEHPLAAQADVDVDLLIELLCPFPEDK